MSLGRLTKRAEFLTVRKGARASRPLVTVEARRRDETPLIRVGFTATKRIGNAVARNRAKRRLREAARSLLLETGAPGCDYVLLAREQTATAPWAALLDDLRSALIRLRPGLEASPVPKNAPHGVKPRRKDE